MFGDTSDLWLTVTFVSCSAEYEHSIGCYADVMAYMDSQCSGRQTCTILIATLEAVAQPCDKDFKSYLQATYSCVPGKTRWLSFRVKVVFHMRIPAPLVNKCQNLAPEFRIWTLPKKTLEVPMGIADFDHSHDLTQHMFLSIKSFMRKTENPVNFFRILTLWPWLRLCRAIYPTGRYQLSCYYDNVKKGSIRTVILYFNS